MTYDSLTPEQQARADALHAAAAALGSPKDTFDDDIVRAGHWIITGQHGAILEFFDGTPGVETHLDGGDVDQGEPAPAETPTEQPRVGVNVTRTPHHPSWDENYGQDQNTRPPRQQTALESVMSLRESGTAEGGRVLVDGQIAGLATGPAPTLITDGIHRTAAEAADLTTIRLQQDAHEQ